MLKVSSRKHLLHDAGQESAGGVDDFFYEGHVLRAHLCHCGFRAVVHSAPVDDGLEGEGINIKPNVLVFHAEDVVNRVREVEGVKVTLPVFQQGLEVLQKSHIAARPHNVLGLSARGEKFLCGRLHQHC